MPRRSNRGGARMGVAGRTYSNRTDLALAPVRQPAPIPAPSAPPAAQQPQGGVNPLDLLAQHVQNARGSLALGAPSQRPAEPVTAGVPSGPGPNEVPSTLSLPAPQQALAALNSIPTASPQVKALRDALNAAAANQGSA